MLWISFWTLIKKIIKKWSLADSRLEIVGTYASCTASAPRTKASALHDTLSISHALSIALTCKRALRMKRLG